MYSVEGYFRELPPEAQTSLGSVKKLEFNVTDPEQLKKLENIFDSYRRHHPSWVAPRRLGGRDAYGVFLKLNAPGLVQKASATALRLPLEQWIHRPARVSFSIKPYRFTNQQGIIIIGGTAQFQGLEFLVLENV